MGTVRLCVHNQVNEPYFIKVTGVRLYSIEELAYYLYENVYLIDEQMVGEVLYTWIERELNLKALAESLRSNNGTGNQVYAQVMQILKAAGYHSEEELLRFSEKIKLISELQTQERMKYKADELCGNGRYWEAITEYECILSIRQSSRLDVSFYANVWNNLAFCYCKLFMYHKAAICYENAFQFHKIPEFRKKAYGARVLSSLMKKEKMPPADDKMPVQEILHINEILKAAEAGSSFSSTMKEARDCMKSFEKEYLAAAGIS